MGSLSIHSHRLTPQNAVAQQGVEKSPHFTPTVEKVATVALSQDLPTQTASSPKKEEKRSYAPMIYWGSGLLVVVGCLYYRAQVLKAFAEVEEKKILYIKEANQIKDRAHALANVLCENICKLLRDDAQESENLSKIELISEALITCQNFQGKDFCST